MKQMLLDFWETHSADILPFAGKLAAAAGIIVIGIILSKGAQRLVKRAALSTLHIDGSAVVLLRAIVRYGIAVICVIMILNIFGVNTASLLAVLGAAGLAVGLALKDVLANAASGIIILFLRNYHRGEFIEFGAFSGTVREINLFTTILETPDGVYVSAPNSSIWGSPLKNYTRNGKRRMELSIGIAYSDSVELAVTVMQEIASAEPRFLAEPPPQVIVQEIEDHSVKITLRAWASVEQYWNTYWDAQKTLKTRFEAAGLRIPLPQREIRIVSN